jgi:c-di-AMP phosphodiesterase-like protein|tara:strand:- start:3860 stop:4093 length:234 start_codon:yes stop_codon:yes gene_type:complete
MKLKTLLEGYAWERNADGSLPTLADATQKHQANTINENDKAVELAFIKVVDHLKEVTKNLNEDQINKIEKLLSDQLK